MKPQYDSTECERRATMWGLIALLMLLACVALAWLTLYACLLHHPRLAIASGIAIVAVWCGRGRALAIAGYWEDCRLRNMMDEAHRNRL